MQTSIEVVSSCAAQQIKVLQTIELLVRTVACEPYVVVCPLDFSYCGQMLVRISLLLFPQPLLKPPYLETIPSMEEVALFIKANPQPLFAGAISEVARDFDEAPKTLGW